jgi:hypothetical protein
VSLQDIAAWRLAAGEEVVLPKDTKLFLASGTVQISDVPIAGPRQIYVTSMDKNVTAMTDAYGVTFE